MSAIHQILLGATGAAVEAFTGDVLVWTAPGGFVDFCVGGIQCPNNDILIAWQHITSEIDNNGSIYYSRSTDGGETWSVGASLVNTAAIEDWEPQFRVIGSTIFFFYVTADQTDPTTHASLLYKTSANNGVTWSVATEIAHGVDEQCFTISNPIVKQFAPNAGRVILPIWFSTSGGAIYASTVYSDNNGSSWTRGGNAENSASLFGEPTIVEQDNGDVVMFLRRNNGGLYQYRCTSRDAGVTWNAVVRSNVVSPRAQSMLLRLANNHIAVLFNNLSTLNDTPRVPLSIQFSADGMATWDRLTDVQAAAGQYSNMCLIQLADARISALYSNEAPADLSEPKIRVNTFVEPVGVTGLAAGLVDGVNDSSLKGYWRLDEASGARADTKGVNNLAATGSVDAVLGLIGNAAHFDGTTLLSIADNAALSIGTSDFSISFWIKRTNIGNKYIVSKGGGGSADPGYSVAYNTGGGGPLAPTDVEARLGNGTTTLTAVFASQLIDSEWTHVAVVFVRATNVTIYVNGTAGGVTDISSFVAANIDEAAPFTVGAYSGVSDNMTGYLDELLFTKRALTLNEVKALANGGGGARPTGV